MPLRHISTCLAAQVQAATDIGSTFVVLSLYDPPPCGCSGESMQFKLWMTQCKEESKDNRLK
jgi:hypothetical protein